MKDARVTLRGALFRSLLAAVLVCALVFCASRIVRAQDDAPNIGHAIHLVPGNDSQSAGLVIDLTREAVTRFEVLENPDRLVIDLEGVVFP
ncbi:MAG TPA: hypothetical protein PKW21_02740, partial [Rhabdaerophilum sp.]|nr:hypothetical protein [Rhabdaerophilum sp.]